MKNTENYYPFKLTEEQEELVKRLLAFIRSDEKVFILKGYAGTGKTTIMQGLVKLFGEQKKPFALMASTGRAAKVMSQKARFPAATVHGSIYALQIVELPKKDEKAEEANYRLTFRLKMPNFNERVVYFVDESSMLTNSLQSGGSIAFGSGRLLDDLFKFAGQGKVVFIGDPAQLPPVNSKFSAALSREFLTSTFDLKVTGFELKQVMRYRQDSGMYYNTSLLREVILSNRFPPLAIKAHGFDDIQVYKHDNDLVSKYYEVIKTIGVDSAIYITLSNKQAALVNNKIRAHLWGYKNTAFLKSGESLMVARNNYLYGLNNGDLTVVDNIENEGIKKAGLEFRYITISVTDPDPEKGQILKRVLINVDLLSSNNRDLSASQDTELLQNYFGRMRVIATEIWELLNQVTDVEKRRSILGEKIKRFDINLDVDSVIEKAPSKKSLIKSIAYDNMQTDPYLNALRVKYGYAITCHKAQGSEWPEVFIHMERSMFYFDKENQYRWAYTALSRAEKKIHLLNNQCLY